MAILIAASSIDKAALNIADKLIRYRNFEETREIFDGKPVYRLGEILLASPKVDSIYASNLDQVFSVEEIIFASRHKSEAEEPSLTVHVPGNLTDQAPYGGRPKEVAWANPKRIRSALLTLLRVREKLKLRYSVALESTHHGPTEMEVPVSFVEIGSNESQWIDPDAGMAVAEAIWASINDSSVSPSAVGFGGGHYCPTHTKVAVERNLAIGHIMSKHSLETVDPTMVKLVFERTKGECNYAVFDWKGMRGETRTELLKILRDMDIEVLRA